MMCDIRIALFWFGRCSCEPLPALLCDINPDS